MTIDIAYPEGWSALVFLAISVNPMMDDDHEMRDQRWSECCWTARGSHLKQVSKFWFGMASHGVVSVWLGLDCDFVLDLDLLACLLAN